MGQQEIRAAGCGGCRPTVCSIPLSSPAVLQESRQTTSLGHVCAGRSWRREPFIEGGEPCRGWRGVRPDREGIQPRGGTLDMLC